MDQMDQVNLGEDNSYLPKNLPKKEKKRSPLGQIWSFTLNNWTNLEMDQMDQIFSLSTWPAAVGQEVGEGGTPHLQCWVDFGKRVRPVEMKEFGDLKRIHWGDAYGRPQRVTGDVRSGPTYCAKDGKCKLYNGAKVRREVVFPEFTKWWQKHIMELIGENPDDRSIHWFYSTEKGVGKTTFAKYLVMKKGACMLDGKKNDVKNAVLTWMKEYGEYPELCVWNIPASLDADYISYTALEQVKDALFYSGKYEGGPVAGPCPHVIIFANVPPSGGDMDARRFVVHNVNDVQNDYLKKKAWEF